MTSREVVLRKLALVREHLARVERRAGSDLNTLRADIDRTDALSMSLLVALQESIDIAFHVVTDDGIGIPASNAESFELLATRGIVTAELARRLTSAAGLRNRIAHGYADIDIDRLWTELPAGVASLREFTEALIRWLGA